MASAVPEFPLLARDQAFEALYRLYVKDVYHYALALLRNPADAEDVTQTTFMNAYRAYKRGEEILKPQNWLIKIAHNVARTRYARAGRRVKEVPLDDHVDQLAVPEEERPNIAGVLRALGRLPFNQRAALIMRELEGRSYAEIADTLDISVSAVETLIFRARKALRLRASSLRVLTVVPLPGSLSPLSPLFGGGAVVAGGGAAAGTGFLAKAAIAIVAGAFATGIGGGNPQPAETAQADIGVAPASNARQLDAAGQKEVRAATSRPPRMGPEPTSGSPGTASVGTREAPVVGTSSPTDAAPVASTGTASPSSPVQEAATEVVAKIDETAATPPLPVQVPGLPPLPVELPLQLPVQLPPLPPPPPPKLP